MEFERNQDGTLKFIITMGDLITKEPLSEDEAERQRKMKELKEKYDKKVSR